MKVLIIGCGFLGKHISYLLKNKTSLCVTTTQKDPKIANTKFEILKPALYRKIPSLVKDNDIIIVTASATDHNYHTSYLVLSRYLKKALQNTCDKTLIYTSSTGVYAENSGNVVYEYSPLDIEKSHILIETEKNYLSLANVRVVIFRLSGLVGHFERTLENLYTRYQNIPMYPKHSNFIYVEDAACAVEYACFHPIRGIYNLSSFSKMNTEIFEEIFHKKPLITSRCILTHGGSKQVKSGKIINWPNFTMH